MPCAKLFNAMIPALITSVSFLGTISKLDELCATTRLLTCESIDWLAGMLHGLLAFDRRLRSARGVDGAVPAGGKRLPVAPSPVDKRIHVARSAVRMVRAASEAVADAKAKADIIQAFIQHGIDVASELYAKTKDDLRELSKKEMRKWFGSTFPTCPTGEQRRIRFNGNPMGTSAGGRVSRTHSRARAAAGIW
jgi:hypothetical protein